MSCSFDQSYLEALKACDPEAEKNLVFSFRGQLKSSLHRRFRSLDIADDAIQETFVRVLLYFRAGKSLKTASSLPGFVKSVATYVSLEMLRANAHTCSSLDGVPELADEMNPEHSLLSEEQRRIVQQALLRMNTKDAHILRSIFLEDADKDQLCRELQVSRGYLRLLVLRAKRHFRVAVGAADKRNPQSGMAREEAVSRSAK